MRQFGPGKVVVLLIGVALLLCTVTATSEEISDPRAVFNDANDAYKSEQFDEAIAGYRRLLAAGYRRAEVHYNLGNAYFRTGALGRALAQYERARRLNPRDPLIRANLALVRNSTEGVEDRGTVRGFLGRLLFWYRAVSRTEIVILTSSVYILFWVVLSLRLIWRHIAVTRVAVAVVCVAAVLGVSMLAKFNEEEPGRYGVLIGRVVTARAGPDDSSRELFELHDGAEVVIEEDSAGWYRIVLADGKRGWVEAEQLETL